jgi:hypothetical protein
MDGLMIGILVGIFVFSLLIYGGLALLFPEWVGIQGKAAKKIEESHRNNNE